MSSDGDELHHIYAILRRFKYITPTEGPNSLLDAGGSLKSSTPTTPHLSTSLFPHRFLLRLLDARLSELEELAAELTLNLFKRLSGKTKNIADNDVSSKTNPPTTSTKCLELDEYFHYSLYYLYDFLIELDWHESDIEKLSTPDARYVKERLINLDKFFSFQQTLTNIDTQLNQAKYGISTPSSNNNKGKTLKWFVRKVSTSSPSLEVDGKAIKSSLSSNLSKLDGTKRRRRVRFRDSPQSNIESPQRDDQTISDSHSLMALDMIIYAINLFIQCLCNHLADWSSSASSKLKDSFALIKDSKQRLRSNQLNSISKQIKRSNDVYLTVLEHLAEISNVYLNDYLLGTVCAQDTERLLKYKRPRVGMFIQRIGVDVERKLVLRLANQCLQILLDLMISEINLPPVELDADTRAKSKEDIAKGRDNHFNFINSWLNVDGVLFGFLQPKEHQAHSMTTGGYLKQYLSDPKVSTLATGGQFKSSSRILAQMDNLTELMRDLLNEIVGRIQSSTQLKYFLELIHFCLEQSFGIISAQLANQLTVAGGKESKEKILATKMDEAKTTDNMKTIAKCVDSIAVKVRCLKLIHIVSSTDALIKDAALKARINLSDLHLEAKVEKFSENCTQQTGSVYS